MNYKGIPIHESIGKLWHMSADEFNSWRAKNDLPVLLNFFKDILPEFKEWLSQYRLTDDYFFKVVPTSSLFCGGGVKTLVDSSDKGGSRIDVYDTPYGMSDITKKKWSEHNIKINKELLFEPYLQWGYKKFKKRKFILVDELNKGYSDSLQYGLWEACLSSEMSRACLLKKFPVLKLGGVKLGDNAVIGGKNLDFVDLDYLVVDGEWIMTSRKTHIGFSSCRNISFQRDQISFIDFYRCPIKNIEFNNLTIQDFRFIHSNVSGIKFRNTAINGLSFEETSVTGFDFYRCEIRDLDYKVPTKNVSFEREFNNFRKIRTAFQETGRRTEAKQFYYFERCYERKALWKSKSSGRLAKDTKYPGGFKYIVSSLINKKYNFKTATSGVFDLLKFNCRKQITPVINLFSKGIKLKLAYLFSLGEFCLWGYGEKPLRILCIVCSIIFGYSAIYYFSSHPVLNNSFINSIYFSTVTFTTLGYGDIEPTTLGLKIVCSSEAILGVLMFGVLIVGFANRSKY